MTRRTKILVKCGAYDKALEDCLEWEKVLKNEMDKGVKCNADAGRLETPFVIMDFVISKPIYCKEYKYILPDNCSSEDILSIAIGK